MEGENEDEIMYLPPLALRELQAGYVVEIVGSMTDTIRKVEDYPLYKKQMRGRFGIVKWRDEGRKTVGIMTRIMPLWAADMFECHILESPMARKQAGME